MAKAVRAYPRFIQTFSARGHRTSPNMMIGPGEWLFEDGNPRYQRYLRHFVNGYDTSECVVFVQANMESSIAGSLHSDDLAGHAGIGRANHLLCCSKSSVTIALAARVRPVPPTHCKTRPPAARTPAALVNARPACPVATCCIVAQSEVWLSAPRAARGR